MIPTSVWAPRARRVDLVRADGSQIPMDPLGDGGWRGPDLPTETDYGFSVDAGPVRADPRARWLPNGPNGLARTIELEPARSAFRAPPLGEAVIYEMHVGTFTPGGTFASASDRLEHLELLGVTHVELMPIAQFPGTRGWGYDGIAPYSIHEAYGGPRGLLQFVRACHARGLAVLVDVVHNHLGPEGSYLEELAPYYTPRHRTPWGNGLDFDGEHAGEVRRYFIDSAVALLRGYDVDGLRLDAVHAIVDDSPKFFVAELADAVATASAETGRQRILIGEYDLHDPKAVRPRARGGWGLDAHWTDDFHHALHDLAKLAAALLFGSPFVPMLFQGEEWAASTPFNYFCDFANPELQRAVREGRRREHGGHDVADAFAQSTFDACVLRWDELTEPAHRDMLAWYRAWSTLRREHPELRAPASGSIAVRSLAPGVLVVERGAFALSVNFTDQPVAGPAGEIVIASRARSAEGLPARSCVLVQR